MNYLGVFEQVGALYIIMLIGMVANKKNIIEDEAIKSIGKIIINIGVPGVIINSLSTSEGLTGGMIGMTLLISILSYGFMLLIGVAVSYVIFVKKEEKPFFWFASMFGNVGFIGYPMIIAILGSGAVMTAATFNVSFDLLIFSLGIYLMSMYSNDGIRSKFEIKKFINPAIITLIITLTLFFLKVELPDFIKSSAKMIGGLTSPLATLVVGASLNNINIRKAIKNYRILILALIKMTLVPILVALILNAIGISGYPAMVAVVLTGMPVGTVTVIFANLYNPSNIEKASEATVLSTLMLIFTIPVLVYAVSIVS